MMTVDELMAKLREQGVDSLSQVKKAYMEGDGAVTVIRYAQRREG
ncbi:MAG: YetF domain-containing protein [Rhizobacter sp.]